MSSLQLQAESRDVFGKRLKHTRTSGKIPAVVYGHSQETRSLTLDLGKFQRVFSEAGETTLLDLVVDQQAPVKVLVQDVQRHPQTHVPIHVDFHQVSMTEEITAQIPLVVLGEAPAVKELGGILVKSLDELKVECLPTALVHEIAVDVSVLKTFEDDIRVRNLTVPAGIRVLDDADEVVVTVSPPRSEEELAALEGAVEEKVEAVETVEKKTAEEPAEGEALEAAPKEKE